MCLFAFTACAAVFIFNYSAMFFASSSCIIVNKYRYVNDTVVELLYASIEDSDTLYWGSYAQIQV